MDAALFFALATGGLIALQFAVNAALRTWLGSDSPFLATFASYAVGTLAALLCLLIARPAIPSLGRLESVPWWAWTGGAIGVAYVSSSVLLAPRLGATVFIFLVIAGQLGLSLLLDHYGLLGYPVRPFNLARGAGCLLMFVAIQLIRVG